MREYSSVRRACSVHSLCMDVGYDVSQFFKLISTKEAKPSHR